MSAPTVENVPNPRAFGFDAQLGTLLLRFAVGPQRQLVTDTADLQAPRFSTEANPEDVMPAFGDIHSQSDFTGGEGLFNRFRRGGGDRDATRFWDSKGVDVAPPETGARAEVRLSTTAVQVDAIAQDPVRIANAGVTLWATAGTVLRKTLDVTDSSPVFVDDDPQDGEPAEPVLDVAVLGDVPYVALGPNGIHRDVSGWAHWSDVEAVRVWSVFDRIIASDGSALYEADTGSSSSLLYTLPDGSEWSDVTGGAGAIFAAATNGYVYAFAADENGDLTVVSQTELRDERPLGIASRGNVIWLTTVSGGDLRLWQAEIGGAFTLNELQLLRVWEDCSCGVITAARDQVLVGVREPDASYVWRVELATGGLSRGWRTAPQRVDGVLTVSGLAVVSHRNDGVWVETDTLEQSGYVIGPLSDFFRAEDKSWVTGWADVRVDQGQEVVLYFTTDRNAMFDPDHPSWRRLKTYSTSSTSLEVGLGNVVSRSLAGMVKMSRASSPDSPRLRSMSFRSYPGPGDVVIQMPVDVGDQVERRGKRRINVSGRGFSQTLPALRQLEGKAAVCRVYRTGDVIRGLVESVTTPVPAITKRGSVTQVSFVTVRGRRVADAVPFATVGWGSEVWGSQVWGGGQNV